MSIPCIRFVASSILMLGTVSLCQAWSTPTRMDDRLGVALYGGKCCNNCTSLPTACDSPCTGNFKNFNGGGTSRDVVASGAGGCAGTAGAECLLTDEKLNGNCLITPTNPHLPHNTDSGDSDHQ